MAQICIITSTGMKCLSSPIKQHFPQGSAQVCGNAPVVSGLDTNLLTPFRALLDTLTLPASQKDLLVDMVELIVTADVNKVKHFTLVNVP